ncbi:MAG: hypothetical protein ABIG10_04085 [bacterium]
MQLQNYFNSEATKKVLLIGTSLIFMAAIVCMSILLSWQFNARIAQIENAATMNNRRLVEIENFLVQAYQSLNAQEQLQMSTAPEEEPEEEPKE